MAKQVSLLDCKRIPTRSDVRSGEKITKTKSLWPPDQGIFMQRDSWLTSEKKLKANRRRKMFKSIFCHLILINIIHKKTMLLLALSCPETPSSFRLTSVLRASLSFIALNFKMPQERSNHVSQRERSSIVAY